MSNIITDIQVSGVTYTLSAETSGGTVDQTIESGSTNAVAGGAVYNKFDEVEQVTAAALNDLEESLSGKVDTSSIVNSVTSASTDSVIPTAKAVYDVIQSGGTFDLPISAGTGINSLVLNYSGNTANGKYSVAEGSGTTANAFYSHAEGYGTRAGGTMSHAEGRVTNASGYASHAEGEETIASGDSSHAEGYGTRAGGNMSHAEGFQTEANGNSSHVEGASTRANNKSEHASGQYNVSNKASTTFGDSGNTLFSVGNGTSNNARHNAFEIRQNGDIYLSSGGTDIKLQDHLGGGSVTVDTALDSGSTNPVENRVIYNKIDEVEQVTAAALNNINDRLSEDEEVTAAGLNALNDNFGGLKLVKLTEAEYNALATKDSSTLYIIVN